MENWYDGLDDYVPAEERTLNDKNGDNPNIIIVDKDTKINLLEWSRKDFDEWMSYGRDVFRFIKNNNDYNGVNIFQSRDDEDMFILNKDGDLYLLNVYQSNEYYLDDNKITFNGWDYNVVVNTDDMSSKTINIR